MAKKINSASRLRDILSTASQIGDSNIHVYEAWARAVGIGETDPQRRILRAVEVTDLIYDQMEHIRTSMSALGFPEQLYAPHMKRVQDTVLSPTQFLGPWHQLRGNITTDILLALGYCAELLPNEEDEIEDKQLQELLAELNSFEDSLAAAQIPPALAALIRRQLERIRNAIAQYRVIGAKALRDAARSAVLDIVDHREDVVASSGAPEVGRLRKVIDKAIKVADGAIRADKFIEASNKLIALIEKLM